MVEHAIAEAAVIQALREWGLGNKITLDTKLETFDFDSLDLVEVLLDLENDFDFMTTQKQVDKLRTVGDVVELVKQNGTTTD